MSQFVVDTSNALDLHNEANTSPADVSPGFFKWLQGNYAEVVEAGQGIACIIDPRRCTGASVNGSDTVVVQDNSSKIYFLILGLFLIIILVVLLLKK